MIYTLLITLIAALHLAPAWATPRDPDDRGRMGVATLLPEVPQIAISYKVPSRPLWLPEEEPHPSAIRTEGYVCYPASPKDWEQVLRCYQDHPVPGYDVRNIEVIFNPNMNAQFQFQRQLLQQRQGHPRYLARWRNEPLGDERANVLALLESAAKPYFDGGFPDVTLVPVWHGTQRSNLPSLLSAGYTAFCTTDDGYFGPGIYGTLEASYAQLYATNFGRLPLEKGMLLLNWGITFSSYPILSSDFDPFQRRLVVKIQPGVYDSHFVPVVPGDPTNPSVYVPIASSEEPHCFTEIVFGDAFQVLPRYVVTLQARLLMQPNNQDFIMQRELVKKETRDRARKEKEQRLAEKEAEAKRKKEEEKEALRREIREIEDHAQQFALMVSEQRLAEREAEAKRKKEALRREIEDYVQHALMVSKQRLSERKAEAKRKNGEEETSRRKQLKALEVKPVIPALAVTTRRDSAATLMQVPRPVGDDIVIPEIARGYETIYRIFVMGTLIYTDPYSNERIEFPFRDLANPLEGEFDLSRCGDIGRYLSINTGYRKEIRAENAYKVEIWITPRFFIERNLNGNAAHFKPIMREWNRDAAPVGLFWTHGGWNDLRWFDYLTTNSMEELSKYALEENLDSPQHRSTVWRQRGNRRIAPSVLSMDN